MYSCTHEIQVIHRTYNQSHYETEQGFHFRGFLVTSVWRRELPLGGPPQQYEKEKRMRWLIVCIGSLLLSRF